MKKLNYLLVAILFVVGFSACGGGNTEEPKEETTQEVVAQDQTATEAVAESPYAAGEKIYKEKCVVCHQAEGQGIEGAFPPLANSDYLLADKVRAVQQVLNGSNHEITVNGKVYSQPMPFQVDTHEDAVAVINYVLNAFGNNGGTVTLDEVKHIEIVR